jgi:hypothetical protein
MPYVGSGLQFPPAPLSSDEPCRRVDNARQTGNPNRVCNNPMGAPDEPTGASILDTDASGARDPSASHTVFGKVAVFEAIPVNHRSPWGESVILIKICLKR